MDQEMMQLKHELKEFVEQGQRILQKMDGGSMGQRGFYGMRSGNGGYNGSNGNGGYNGNSGGSYGQREHWSQMPMQQGFPQQGYPQMQQDQWQNIDPRWFM